MNVSITNPCADPRWDERLPDVPSSGFFHSRAWAESLQAAYGYKPCYFVLPGNGSFHAVMPLMEVDSALTGRRGVGLPFSDLCPTLAQDVSLVPALVDKAVGHAAARKWKYLEWRCAGPPVSDRPPYQTYIVHTIPLDGGEAPAEQRLRSSTRRNIARARSNVDVRVLTTRAAVETFYTLQLMTRKRHGLPPQPKRFFDCVYEHVIAPGHGFVVLASHGGVPIAANVYFQFRDRLLYKYGASDLRFQHLRANDLTMWEAIRHGTRQGVHSLCLGRTSPANKGLLQFKNGWGAKTETVHYHRYDLRRGQFVQGSGEEAGWHAAFRLLPVTALRILGSLLYRHMG